MQSQSRVVFFVLTVAAFTVSAAACGPAPGLPGPPPGRSDRPRGGPPVPAPTVEAAPAIWERWGEVATYRVAIPRGLSQHLAADHEAETLINEAAVPYPDLGPSRVLPAGAVLVERLFAPGAAAPEVLFGMERRADGTGGSAWEFIVVEPSGAVSARGALEACARCHAEAPLEGLFGRAQ